MIKESHVWSIRMVVEFLGSEFLAALNDYEAVYRVVQLATARGQEVLEEDHQEKCEEILYRLFSVCQQHGFGATASIAARARHDLQNTEYGRRALLVEGQLHALRVALSHELDRTKFVLIPPERVEFFNVREPFGHYVFQALPEAERDIHEAANCLALGLDTAAVFHLMRAVEFGLRDLAKTARIQLKKRKALEWADWQEIINAIQDKKIKQLQNKKRGNKRADDLEFYSGIVGELQGFKDAYRNHVMHTRVHYTDYQAVALFTQVKSFMVRLARRKL